jgi:hypothetical protein
VCCGALKPRQNAEKLRFFIKAQNKFYFLFFTNFESLFFVFIFSDSSFGTYYASPEQAS